MALHGPSYNARSIQDLVAHDRWDEFPPTCSCNRIYRDCAIMELWLPFDDVWNMYPQNFAVRMNFSVQKIVEPLQSL